MEYVPDAEIIERNMATFLVHADRLEGVYGNEDVDSMIFRYRTSVNSGSGLRDALSTAIEGSEWEETSTSDGSMEFRRSVRRSFEVVRVVFVEPAQTVFVAYVQADGSWKDDTFEDTGEGKWAEKNIWPRFGAVVEKERGLEKGGG